jgi:hypothetical protein
VDSVTFEAEAERCIQDIDVLLQPSGEVVRFVFPHFPEGNSFWLSDCTVLPNNIPLSFHCSRECGIRQSLLDCYFCAETLAELGADVAQFRDSGDDATLLG